MSDTEFQSAEMEGAREALSLLKLGRGAVIALDRRIGEPVDVVVNGRTIAKGELVVVEEENSRFGISLKEIMGSSGAPE